MPESHRFAPMLATLARELPADPSGWTFEPKWDGIRALASWNGRALLLTSRSGRDITVSWPDLAALGPTLDHDDVVLDGEIVALDDNGRPSFQRIQERMHVANPASAAQLAGRVPITFVAFDLLRVDGGDLTAEPWRRRRARLEGLAVAGPSWATTPSFPGEGETLLDQARALGLEGVVAKRLDSRYLPGARSRDWLKVKVVASDEFVVAGWSPGGGRREGSIGALVLGLPVAGGGLRHVGQVGTGFTDAELRRLAERLRPLAREASPFTEGPPPRPGAHWVEPVLVAEVAYTERTRDGVLRHPSYKGLRIDKSAADIETVGR